MSQNNYNDLLITLEKTYTSKSTDEIKLAEQKLKKYNILIDNNLSDLLSLLFIPEIDFNVKKSLIVFIKNYIISNNSKATYDKNAIKIIISNIIMSILNNSKENSILSEKIFEQINLIIIDLLNTSIIKNSINLIIEILNFLINKINIINFYYIINFLISILSSKSCNQNNLLDINILLCPIILKYLKEYNNNFVILNKLLELLLLLFKKLNNFKLLNQEINENFISYYFSDISHILNELSKENNNILTFGNINLIENSNNKEINRVYLINQIKCNLLLFLCFLIQYQDKNEIKNEILIQNLPSFLKFLLNSLQFITLNNLNLFYKYSENLNYKNIIYYSLFLFARCIIRLPFRKDFNDNLNEFLITIIYPFLIFSENDRELLLNSPEMYYQNLIDTLIDWNLKNIKTVCGYLLSIISNNFEKNQIIKYTLELLNYNLNDDKNLSNYKLLDNDYTKNYLLKNFNSELLIDLSIHIICIMAKEALKIDNIKFEIKKFLFYYQKKLHEISSLNIQFKICLLYGLFLEDFFSTDFENENIFIVNAIEYLLNLILKSYNSNDVEGLSYQALKSFEQILEVKNYNDLLTLIVNEKMNNLINMISNIKIDIFFDILNSIIKNLTMDKYILKIYEEVINRFKNDINGKLFESNSFITKELNLINNILIYYYKNNDFIEKFDSLIYDIMNYLMKNIENIYYSDEIINILSSLCQDGINRVSNILIINFEYYFNYIKSKNEIDYSMFHILNFLINNIPNNELNNNINYSQYLINILSFSLNNIDEYNGEGNQIYTFLLIIIWLTNKNNLISNINNFENIYQISLNKVLDLINLYKDNPIDILNIYDGYLLLFYLCIIYSGFINYSQNAFNIIFNTNKLLDIINFTKLLDKTTFYSTKLIKFIILGLCSILNNNEILKNIIIYFKDIFLIIFNLLSCQIEYESKFLKKITNDNSNKFINENNDSEEEEENDEDNENFLNFINQANFDLNEIDEFIIFKNITNNKLNNFNETKEIINNILNNLNDTEKNQLLKVYNTKRININYNGKNYFIPRRIIKIKGYNNKEKI